MQPPFVYPEIVSIENTGLVLDMLVENKYWLSFLTGTTGEGTVPLGTRFFELRIRT